MSSSLPLSLPPSLSTCRHLRVSLDLVQEPSDRISKLRDKECEATTMGHTDD